jgi:heavy metal sensor kinase
VSLPIRVRLTAFYAVLLTVIIAALGAFLVLELKADLRARIDRDVRAASARIAHGYATEGNGEFLDESETALPRSGSAAQVRDASGRVLLTYGDVTADQELAPPDVLADALAGRPRLLTVVAPRTRQHYRASVLPVRRLGHRRVLVVAESLLEVEEAVNRVLVLLLIAGPAALAATALAGWWLARSALLPVERMTSEAEGIGIDRLHERVAVPRAADEIGHLAVTLNAMLARLERGMEEQHRLVADASHELRTPLAVMRSELDVSLRGDDLTSAGREVLESAREEVDAMSRIVDNLLLLAQADEGRLGLLTSRVDLRAALEAAARPLRPLAAVRQVRLEVGGERCDAQADAERLHQAITNLVENAIKFTPPGGRVSATAWCHEEEVGVTVTDDGPGIPAADRPHIFDRFYRVDRSRGRKGGGSGLGLAICREIAAAHGGRVWVDSREGQGSAFSLALRRVGEQATQPETPATR